MRTTLTFVTIATVAFVVGCASGMLQNQTDAEMFINENQADLTREMAKGEGQKLRTLAALTGCDSEESQKAFLAMTKDSYNKIVSGNNTSSQEFVNNLRDQMIEDDDVALLCDTASL